MSWDLNRTGGYRGRMEFMRRYKGHASWLAIFGRWDFEIKKCEKPAVRIRGIRGMQCAVDRI